jgi:hypothetical protein
MLCKVIYVIHDILQLFEYEFVTLSFLNSKHDVLVSRMTDTTFLVMIIHFLHVVQKGMVNFWPSKTFTTFVESNPASSMTN